MKVKRFNNLWTMGLIIFGALLVGFYVLKIVCPQFIVGVAEIPSIVKFGNFVDSHLWAYYIFNFLVSFATSYFYCCACLKIKFLKINHIFVVCVFIVLLFVFQNIFPEHYLGINVLVLFLMPAVINYLDGKSQNNVFYSTCFVSFCHNALQIISLEIRDISTMISYPNSATFSILLIDGFIGIFLLYNYFNFKEVIKNG